MSTCYYYLLAEWPDEEAAKETFPKLLLVLREMAQSWESGRFSRLLTQWGFDEDSCPHVPPLDEHGQGEAGQNLEQNGRFIQLFGEVSHLTSWEPLRFLMERLGATAMNWVCEEHFDYFSYLHASIKEPEFQIGG